MVGVEDSCNDERVASGEAGLMDDILGVWSGIQGLELDV